MPRPALTGIPDPVLGEVCIPFGRGCERCGDELTGRKRRWCSGSCREWWYIHHRWTSAREEAMVRAERLCLNCGDRATEVDHIIPRLGHPLHKPTCLHHQPNLRPLCRPCHLTREEWSGEND